VLSHMRVVPYQPLSATKKLESLPKHFDVFVDTSYISMAKSPCVHTILLSV
jgi:hypothetical protein